MENKIKQMSIYNVRKSRELILINRKMYEISNKSIVEKFIHYTKLFDIQFKTSIISLLTVITSVVLRVNK